MKVLSNVRVTYSGLINFVIGLIRIITGLMFMIIVTRSLSATEFGTWSLIVGLITYVLITHNVISFWVTREVAREKDSGKTALFSSAIFSAIGICAYIIIANFVSDPTQVESSLLLFAIIVIPTQFIYTILSSINLGWRPQAVSYGLIILDITKIPLALICLNYYDMGVYGVIISVTFGNIAGSIFLAIFSWKKLCNKLNFKYLKKWFKLSWLPLFPSGISMISVSDVLIFSIILGSTEGLGYYSASFYIASVGTYAAMFAIGSYPKLLAGESKEYLQNNLTRFLYFLIPLTLISITFAKPGLYALNPIYEIAYMTVVFLGLRTFFSTIFVVFSKFLLGDEKVDTSSSSIKSYLHSKLFSIPLLQLIKFSGYIISLIIIFSLLANNNFIDLILYWAIINFIIQIPFTLILFYKVKNQFDLKLEFKKILKYIFSGLISFGFVYLLINNYLEYTPILFDFLPALVFYVIISISMYIGITYAIDSSTKIFINSILQKIKI